MKSNKNELCPAPFCYTFELTMDNDLDQDELNRRLRKPGEGPYDPATGKWTDCKPKRPPKKRASRRK